MQGNRSAAPHPHQSGLPRVPIVCGPKPPCCPALSHCRSHRNGAMLLLQPLRAAHRGVPLLLVVTALMAGVPLVVRAETSAQRQELTAALSQLGALERTVAHSAAHTPIAPGERYPFASPRLLADLARVRAGIQDHLTPSRAQPRDPSELARDYRTERATPASPTPTPDDPPCTTPSSPHFRPTAASRPQQWRPSSSAPSSPCCSCGASGPSERPTWGGRKAASTSASSSASASASSRCTSC